MELNDQKLIFKKLFTLTLNKHNLTIFLESNKSIVLNNLSESRKKKEALKQRYLAPSSYC
jgi:hypothetical protein